MLVLREQNELTCMKCPPYCLESCDALQTSPSHSLWPNIVSSHCSYGRSGNLQSGFHFLVVGKYQAPCLCSLHFSNSQIWSSLTPIWTLSPSYSGPRQFGEPSLRKKISKLQIQNRVQKWVKRKLWKKLICLIYDM